MKIVNKSLNIVDDFNADFKELPKKFKIIIDTEFSQKSKMIVDIIGIYSADINDCCFCYFKEDINDDFNPILEILKINNHSVNLIENETLIHLSNDIGLLFDDLIENIDNSRQIKKIYETSLNDGYFDDILNKYSIDRNYLKYIRKNKESAVYIAPPKISVELEFFFAIADLFKIFGKNHQHLLLNSELNQYRSLKVKRPILFYAYIDSVLSELNITIKDCYYRIQPANDRSLNGNARALGLSQSKIDIKTDDIRQELGLNRVEDIMSNFSLIAEKMPNQSAIYNAQDIFLTDDVSQTQQELLDKLRNDFNINNKEISDTTGSTVSTFIKDLLLNHFGIKDKKDDDLKIINELFSLTKIKNLQDVALNDFGIQPFLTVGGLLFSRCANYPFIEGKLSDCDLSSCYATYMSNMSIYLGEPIIRTFKYKKYKPLLRDVIKFVKSQNLNRDAWFIRVSGELKTAFNTLIMSDLRFENKIIKCPTVADLNPSKKSVELFNAYKTPKKQASSTLLLKEIKFGLINADLLDCIELLPKIWIEDYLDLSVDALIFIPNELIADNINQLLEIRENLPDEYYKENFNPKTGIKDIESQYCKNNVCLKFDIGQYWNELKSKRNVYKKAKNPVQEIFKLVGNSGYGVLACLHLATNNLLASNMITAGARSASWMMTNALNGFAPITDGTCFNWDTIPIGLKFKQLLLENNQYLFNYDNSIKSNFSDNHINNWLSNGNMNDNFLNHIYSFYDIDKSHIVANRYGYELKTEKFDTIDKNTIETVFFTKYYNTNAGNYSKGMNECNLLIDDKDYDFNEQNNYIKARSFNGKNDDLINWYLSSLKKYQCPMIYSENKIMKFSDGNALAIRLLKNGDCGDIAHPMGFATKGYKTMKLISRSQFLFLNEVQIKNFTTNEIKLSELSKYLLDRKFWAKLKNIDIEKYNVTINQNIDYYEFSKTHSVGVGYELLSLSKNHDGDVGKIRKMIFNKIIDGCTDFNAALNINRCFKYGETFKYLLAAIIILKANAEYDLIECLKSSANEATILKINKENIRTLSNLWSDYED